MLVCANALQQTPFLDMKDVDTLVFTWIDPLRLLCKYTQTAGSRGATHTCVCGKRELISSDLRTSHGFKDRGCRMNS